jgi:hypothetical protein
MRRVLDAARATGRRQPGARHRDRGGQRAEESRWSCSSVLHAFVERANLRHYRFLVEGLPELADGLARRGVGFVLRRSPITHCFRSAMT